MPDYDEPKIPPATPPAIDPHTDPAEARTLADDDGDSDCSGSAEPSERREANEALEKRQAKRMDSEGAGEQELDATTPATLSPPD